MVTPDSAADADSEQADLHTARSFALMPRRRCPRCGSGIRERISSGSWGRWQRRATGVSSTQRTARRRCRDSCSRDWRAEQKASVRPTRRAGSVRPTRERRVAAVGRKRSTDELPTSSGAQSGQMPVGFEVVRKTPAPVDGEFGVPAAGPSGRPEPVRGSRDPHSAAQSAVAAGIGVQARHRAR